MRRLLSALALCSLVAATAAVPAAADGPKRSVVKIKVGKLSKRTAQVMSSVPVYGSLAPFAAGERVNVTFFRNGKPVKRVTKRVRKGKGNYGTFRARIKLRAGGKYAVGAVHRASRRLRGDRTVRKAWRVTFPALDRGDCGDVVRGFKRALRRMGYIANRGPCLMGRTARGVLAYRKVNGMTRSMHAGSGVVKRVYAGKGRYKVRHPGAGRHVEAPLDKQVLVFAKGGKPTHIYPTSSGTASTPTVTGHYTFQRTEPGYNNLGMYYSWYFYGGYAVHGYESVPNYPASHGCLRTFIADQPEIFERIRYGEDIFVF